MHNSLETSTEAVGNLVELDNCLGESSINLLCMLGVVRTVGEEELLGRERDPHLVLPNKALDHQLRHGEVGGDVNNINRLLSSLLGVLVHHHHICGRRRVHQPKSPNCHHCIFALLSKRRLRCICISLRVVQGLRSRERRVRPRVLHRPVGEHDDRDLRARDLYDREKSNILCQKSSKNTFPKLL